MSFVFSRTKVLVAGLEIPCIFLHCIRQWKLTAYLNHLTQTRNYIFSRCCVVESFKFHPELILNVLRDSEFYLCDTFIYCTALYNVFLIFFKNLIR